MNINELHFLQHPHLGAAYFGFETILEIQVRGIQREGREDVENEQRKDAKQTGALDFISRKIIIRANGNQEDPLEFSTRFCKEFMIDTTTNLQCLPPTEQPYVSGHNTNDAFKCYLRKDQMHCFKMFIGSLAL